MAKLDAVTRHAITAPIFDKTKLHRERLVDEIHANIPRKLIAVAAPPGYGKTTLLADFTEHTDFPVCWVRISETDRDMFRFASVLNTSLQRRFRRLQNQIDLDKLSGSTPEALAGVFAATIDANVSEPFAILLDDVHLINSSKETTKFLDAFLEVMPEQVTIIAAGREVLEVSLARLMAEGNLGGLGPQDLALSIMEVNDLAEIQSGSPISEADAERLLQETKGWVTGLLLSGELSGRDMPSMVFEARPMVYEYLASVVLNRQPDHVRRFMLDSAVFPIMTAAACDQVLEREDSQKYLNRLVREGLFVSATNETPRTYEFHPMFREFLLDSLQGADPRRLRKLRVLAADYLVETDQPEYAIGIYCDAASWKRAAVLAERYAQDLFWRGRWQTLEQWTELLAPSGQSTPMLYLLLAQSYTDQGRLEAAETALERASEIINEKSPKAVRVLYHTDRGLIARRRGQWDTVLEEAKKGQKLLSKRGSRLRKAECMRLEAWGLANGQGRLEPAAERLEQAVQTLRGTDHEYTLATTMLDLATIQVALGEIASAYATSQKAHQIFLGLSSPSPLAISYNNLAYLAHTNGEYDQALNLFNEALKYARQSSNLNQETYVLYGQADVFSDLDLVLQAAELYGQGLRIATQLDDVALIEYGCLRTSILHQRRGSLPLAHEWLKRAISLSDESAFHPRNTIQLASLELSSRPEYAHDEMVKLLKENSEMDAFMETWARWILTKSSFESGDLTACLSEFKEALDFVGAKGTEQVLASELVHSDRIRNHFIGSMDSHPVFSVILRRIETMQSVASVYQKEIEEPAHEEQITFLALGTSRVQTTAEADLDLKPLPREILFFLVDRGKVERDVLLEAFWPSSPPGKQVANLHTAVYSLRRSLGREAITYDGTTYSINPDIHYSYDVVRYERAVSVAETLPPGDPRRMFALTEAINLYTGPFLPEINSEWVVEKRRTLELQYLDLLSNHAEEALVRDQPAKAIKTLRMALEIDPYRDDTNTHFIEALGLLGRRSELVDHYQKYVRLLSNDLGLDPPDTIRELYTRIIG